MDRETMGKKYLEHLGLQGEIEAEKKNQAELLDQIKSNEHEISRLESLKKETESLNEKAKASADNLADLEKELDALNTEIEKAGGKVPFINEQPTPPTHVKF